uniref:Uncharacterized protein n=1 Tax=Anguilla anguilla TaxID=7936 RepID=A0A0E9RPD4_ANGAN
MYWVKSRLTSLLMATL